jgi:hypothetical protein
METTITPTYLPSDGSVYKCEEPGVVDDQEHCNKFWLCKEETEGSGVLEVSSPSDITLWDKHCGECKVLLDIFID